MEVLKQAFSVKFEYNVYFTKGLFNKSNNTFRNFFDGYTGDIVRKIFFVIDGEVALNHPGIKEEIAAYMEDVPSVKLIEDILVIPGGEIVKNDDSFFYQLVDAVDTYGIDRHSYIAAIGGGAILDLAGFAAAVSHRGIRHIRIPSTVLSQNDSGIGVKNSINYHGKKNFLGAFTPPVAVFNDEAFLSTLSLKEWRSGIAEAVKVALIKDQVFFEWIEANGKKFAQRDDVAMRYLIKKCAELHLEHIGGGDPFELGSSRPLDFGHWSAHKTEQLSGFSIRHGEAVAMGIALDTAYSFFCGMLSEEKAERVINTLQLIGFDIIHPLMKVENDESPVIKGLGEFREHLGGKLTIMLLEDIGKGVEVHSLDTALLKKASEWLGKF